MQASKKPGIVCPPSVFLRLPAARGPRAAGHVHLVLGRVFACDSEGFVSLNPDCLLHKLACANALGALPATTLQVAAASKLTSLWASLLARRRKGVFSLGGITASASRLHAAPYKLCWSLTQGERMRSHELESADL